MKPGYYKDVSNADYHAGEGISKSQLDMINQSPATLIWSRNAPEDDEKKGALNLGTAVHTMLLEPEKFAEQFIVEPVINARTKAGQQQRDEFQAMAKASGRIVLSSDEARKASMMRESVMANPEARKVLEAEGDAESSAYWEDPETGVLCRCRPDWYIPAANLIVDVKTTADMSKFRYSITDFRYDVQDAFYTDGMTATTGQSGTRFWFLVVSSSVSCGKYPVKIIELQDEDKEVGRTTYRANLATYAECLRDDVWPGVETVNLYRRQS